MKITTSGVLKTTMHGINILSAIAAVLAAIKATKA